MFKREIIALSLAFMGLLVAACAALLIVCSILSPAHKGLILFMGIFLGIGGIVMLIKGKYDYEVARRYD